MESRLWDREIKLKKAGSMKFLLWLRVTTLLVGHTAVSLNLTHRDSSGNR